MSRRRPHKDTTVKIGQVGEQIVAASIRRYLQSDALRTYNNVYFRDERGNPFQIDHLALTPQGLIVVETKHWAGMVWGGESERNWSYLPNGRYCYTRQFYSPVLQNRTHVQKLKRVLDNDLKMASLVVFGNPTVTLNLKGVEGVYTLAGFEAALESIQKMEAIYDQAALAFWHERIMSSRFVDFAGMSEQLEYAQNAKNLGCYVAHKQGLRT
nr:NERD domain-containing protein [Bacilli bacterium]